MTTHPELSPPIRACERLRYWRAIKGISQAEAAALIGATRKAWGTWESGVQHPSIDFAVEIERVTGGFVSVPMFAEARAQRRAEVALELAAIHSGGAE